MTEKMDNLSESRRWTVKPKASYETEIKELRAKVGALVLQNDVLRKLSRLPG